MARPAGALIAAVAVGLALASCGDEEPRYRDDRIAERLNLERSEAGFAIDGDPFCEVAKKLLNTADEVEEAADRDELGLVIASRARNAGIQGVPPFAPDCADDARRKLNRLDPEPEE